MNFELNQRQWFDKPDLKYSYPDDLNLKPGSELHNRICREVFERANLSRRYIENRYDSWMEIDKSLMAYKEPSSTDKGVEPDRPVSVVIPITFAVREAILTYLSSSFLSRPIFRYRGVEGDDVIKAALLEILVDLHCYQSKVQLALYSMWQDAISYGIGIGLPHWARRYGKGRSGRYSDSPYLMWEGNALGCVSPYDALPDPNVSVNNIQMSSFFGYIEHTTLAAILGREQSEPSRFFNARYLHRMESRRSFNQPESPYYSDYLRTDDAVDVVNMIINLIPKQWNLGQSEYPQKWIFAVAGDGLIIRAEPLGLFYDEYPVVACAPLFDDYSASPVSLLERLSGMQKFVDWLINIYIVSSRKVGGINIVYDPMAINGADLRSSNPVKLIRLNKTHWGRGDVSRYIHQLNISNPAENNVAYVSAMFDIIQRVSGASDLLQGIMRTGGERRSATEAHDAITSAISRVQKSARLIAIQCHQDIARMFAYNIQQMMSDDKILAITGEWKTRLEQEYGYKIDTDAMKVTPGSLLNFDFNIVSHDASIPGEEDRDAWVRLGTPLLGNPEAAAAMGLDLQRIFLHIARQLGATDASEFIKRNVSTRIVPDEFAVREAERGNLIPITEESLNNAMLPT